LLRYREDFYCVLCTTWKGAFKMLAPSVVFLKRVNIIKFRDIIRENASEAWRTADVYLVAIPREKTEVRNWIDATIRHTLAGDDTTIISAFAWSVREDRRKLQSWSLNPSRFRAGSFRRRVYILTATPICCMQCRNQCCKRSRRGQPAVIYKQQRRNKKRRHNLFVIPNCTLQNVSACLKSRVKAMCNA
jgi:hypothetical protein